MTSTATPTVSALGRPTTVRDRRRATLERLHGGRVPERRRRKSSSPSEEANATLEELGPPPGTFYAIAGVVIVFVMLGLVMVLSASAVTQANLGYSPYRIFSRQAVWALIGLAGMLIAARMPYRYWRYLTIPLALIGVAAMVAPFMPGIGATINGTRSWVRIGDFSVQPSELLKLVAVVVIADLLVRRKEELADTQRTLVPLGLIAAVGAGLCLAQGDLGSAVVLGAIVFAVAWIGGLPFFHLLTLCSFAVTGVLGFVMSSPRRLDRFTAFLNVSEEKDHLAYQTYQGFLSMASGGLTGSGIGGSNGKLGYLPYAHSDFIFAIVAEELGWIGATTVVLGFGLLVWFGIQTALAAPDRFGMLLAGGISAWFAVQTIINLGGVTGLMPVTGLTLPFFSAGGSSLFVSMVAAGMLLSVARRIGSRPVQAGAARGPN